MSLCHYVIFLDQPSACAACARQLTDLQTNALEGGLLVAELLAQELWRPMPVHLEVDAGSRLFAVGRFSSHPPKQLHGGAPEGATLLDELQEIFRKMIILQNDCGPCLR